MTANPIPIRLSDDTAAAVALRHTPRKQGDGGRGRGTLGRGTVVGRDLARYYALLDRAERSLRHVLTEDEWRLCMAALANSAWTPDMLPHAHMTVDNAMSLDGLHTQFGVDRGTLMTKLGDLTPLENAALVDAAERAIIDA